MTEIARTLTETEVELAIQQANMIGQASHDLGNANNFVFFAAFDGTRNSEDLGVARVSQSTAVLEVATAIRTANADNENVRVGYFPGVGTAETEWGSAAIPTYDIVKAGETAYEQFAERALAWRKKHPDGEITSEHGVRSDIETRSLPSSTSEHGVRSDIETRSLPSSTLPHCSCT